MANYSDLRTIPREIKIAGERAGGIDYIGCANSQLKILEHELSLGTVQDGYRTTRIGDCVIEAWKFGNQSGAKITVLGGNKEEKKESQECFCTCHVAVGYVQSRRYGCPDMTGYTGNNPQKYDVVVCEKKDSYMLIKNCLPMSMTMYRKGERVLVVFQPGIGKKYAKNTLQGCSIRGCRITNIADTHPRFYNQTLL